MARLHTKEHLRSSFRERFRNNVLVMRSVQIWGTAFQFRGVVLVPKRRRGFRHFLVPRSNFAAWIWLPNGVVVFVPKNVGTYIIYI